MHLAHPAAIKKYEGLKHSGDFADAAYLPQLPRLGLLAEGYVYPREERGARDLARKRMQLVRYRTAQILSIEGILMRQTGGRMKGEAIQRLTVKQVDELGFAPDVTLALEANRAVSQALGQQIDALEKRLKERVSLRSEYRLLKVCNLLNRPSREPLMDWRRQTRDSHAECKRPLGHDLAPKLLWGGKCCQGGRRRSRPA